MTEDTKKLVERVEKNFDRGIIGEREVVMQLYDLYSRGLLSEDERKELASQYGGEDVDE